MGASRAGFELRDHTADIALYVWADSLEGLFSAAAEGLYATIGQLRQIETDRKETIRVEAFDLESRLHDFLSELLYHFEMRGERLVEFTFDGLDNTVLEVTGKVGMIDEKASVLDREVKAVTYHDLNIIRCGDRYEVTIILDI